MCLIVMNHSIVEPCIFFWRLLYLCTSACASVHLPVQRCSPLRSFTVPPLLRDPSLTSFPLLFSRFRLESYIKCLQAAEILPSSLSKVIFFPMSLLLTLPHLDFPMPRSLIDDAGDFKNYTTHGSCAYIAMKHFECCHQVDIC